MVKTLWLVRHAERADNVSYMWKRDANPLGLSSDNPPLSVRGRKQCTELSARFEEVPVDYVFSSPFERTMETATTLIGLRKDLLVKVEPGLGEVMYLCENPPGFETAEALKTRFPLVDTTYKSLYCHENMPRERFGFSGGGACVSRVRNTIEHILEEYKDAESLLFVSHSSVLGAAHHVLTGGSWAYVGQATVAKYVFDQPQECDFNGKRKWRCVLLNDKMHLSDPTNLRDESGSRVLARGMLFVSVVFLILSYAVYRFGGIYDYY